MIIIRVVFRTVGANFYQVFISTQIVLNAQEIQVTQTIRSSPSCITPFHYSEFHAFSTNDGIRGLSHQKSNLFSSMYQILIVRVKYRYLFECTHSEMLTSDDQKKGDSFLQSGSNACGIFAAFYLLMFLNLSHFYSVLLIKMDQILQLYFFILL